MKTKLTGKFLLALTIFSLMGQVAWVVENMYFNVFIYKMFNATPGDISLMVSASAIAATVTTVFMGALSDKVGKRKLFICLGYILWGVSIFSFTLLREDVISATFQLASSAAAIGISLTIILDCVMTFFGSTANDAAFNAWLTDSTDESCRGSAEGINSMMPLVAILVVFGGFMFFDLEKAESWSLIFTIIGALTFLIGLLGFFIIKEPQIEKAKEPYFKSIFYGFRPKTIKANPMLYVTLLAFIIFNTSIQVFMPYLIIYYEVSLGLTGYVLIMAPAIILAAAATVFWGKVYDKRGFNFAGIIAVLGLIAGYFVLYLFRSTPLVFIGSLLMMCGYLSGMAVFGAQIRDYTPKGKSGMLQGVRIFSQVLLPGVIGPTISKMVLKNAEVITNNDGTTSFVPNANIFLWALIVAVLVIPFFMVIKKIKKPRIRHLKTPFADDITDIPHSEYPRPQFKRDSYLCLNGKWQFSVKSKKGTKDLGEILVPFPPESTLSGVMRKTKKGDTLIYTRRFRLEDGFFKDKLILNIGACDQICQVFINGELVGENVGGYLPFAFDITPYLKDNENEIRVEVRDPLDINLPYGKQSKKRGGMWYTATSGIWGSVWLESTPKNAIENIKITPTLSSVKFEVMGGENQKTLIIEGKEYKFSGNEIEIEIENPRLWTPETPNLYNFTLISGEDKIESYFALRTIGTKEVGDKTLLTLNGEPYFFNGLLDQGYFSDGIYLPATNEGFKNDILKMKECGFNMLRKHIKLEPDLFYYYCDTLGMAVFQDFINNGKYSFLIDTALPTVFLKSGFEHTANQKRRREFIKTGEGIVNALYNHPSVVYYTIFNEGWGQFKADDCYTHFKALDPTRIYDATSGWFKKHLSDVESEHVYFKKLKLKSKKGRPLVLSEFGGYSYKIDEHSFNLDNTYGYRFFKDGAKFQTAIKDLYIDEVLPAIRDEGLSGAVLTQVSDVEDETNGLLTYDRAVLKVDPKEMQEVNATLLREFNKYK